VTKNRIKIRKKMKMQKPYYNNTKLPTLSLKK